MLALEGHSEVKIQIFGRWGSNAVLRYVREALLGKRAAFMRPTENALSLGELRACVVARAESHGGVGAKRKAMAGAEAAMERLLESKLWAAMDTQKEELLAFIEERLEEVLHDSTGHETKYTAVQCTRTTGRTHVRLSDQITFCSWPWSANGGVLAGELAVPSLGSDEAKKSWCTRCLQLFHSVGDA